MAATGPRLRVAVPGGGDGSGDVGPDDTANVVEQVETDSLVLSAGERDLIGSDDVVVGRLLNRCAAGDRSEEWRLLLLPSRRLCVVLVGADRYRRAWADLAGRPARPTRSSVQSCRYRSWLSDRALLHAPRTSSRSTDGFKKVLLSPCGVDLIIVRADDSDVKYDDSDIAPDGASANGRLPAPGRYRTVVDVYPKVTSLDPPFNFDLFKWVTVAAAAPTLLCAANSASRKSSMMIVSNTIEAHRQLRAIARRSFLNIKVLEPEADKVVLHRVAWCGARASSSPWR